MSKRKPLLFQVGQRAELRSSIPGFRGAWFRCELKDVARRKGEVKYRVQYFDYDDGLEWVKLYEIRKKGSEKAKRELMLRPQFPSVYHESELLDTNAISDVAVVVNGDWIVGDMVDWKKDGCFWSGTVTKVLGNKTVEIKLPDEPVGEGLTYIVSRKDLRPSLNWSPDSGWTFPAPMESRNGHSCAHLIHPVKQAPFSKPLVDTLVEDKATSTSLDFNDSISSHTSTSSLPLLSKLICSKGELKPSKDISGKDRGQTRGERDSSIRKPSCSDSVSSSYVRDTSAEIPAASSAEKKDPENATAKKKRLNDAIPLNSMSCDSVESAITDLEELVCRVKWLKQILKSENPSTSLHENWEYK
ncbi:uncharacterized protein LOC141656525 [Silene latifolia]|uniref:uncharacterized protein LOC141656525 n=1 Tax=Silene latifolia TaxID=37657 RepID=UPI003D775440